MLELIPMAMLYFVVGMGLHFLSGLVVNSTSSRRFL